MLRLKKKAAQSKSKYRISAIAFDERGDFVPGIGVHAEYKLMMKYGSLIKTIFISRIGHSGEWRPIKPCANCQALADKLGIKLITIKECQ